MVVHKILLNFLPAFLHNRANVREAIFGRVSRKYQILLRSVSMPFWQETMVL